LPTFETPAQFDREFAKLTATQQEAFKRAVGVFVADLRAGRSFSRGLRVKRLQGKTGVFEMTWASNGRATWQYGPEQQPGEPHVIWRRIGTHDIFRSP